ncbi:sulfatase-like hydrolase/transferase [Phragmitibacter flavus]|nr:sulfatase-like hydrolase/transferase [Phragmitibacter flavus]
MNWRTALVWIFYAMVSPWGSLLASEVRPVRPNVVVFLADDAGWGDYEINGNEMVKTPRIDSIGRDGVSFERFYVCPVCSPTRAEFLTGRYYLRTGVRGVSTGQERLNVDEKTVADAFKAAGYATGAFGKWHNGSQWPYHPTARGFDEYFGHTSGHWGEYVDAPLEENGEMVRTKGYIVDVCTDKALEFIERNQAKPFFCFVPFTTPHSPWKATDEDWERWKGRELPQRGTDVEKEVADETRCALAMVENQDWNVGRVLDKLEALGLSKNTIVVYFSDNGPNGHRWNGGMKGKKGGVDEGSVRSPLLVKWPEKVVKGGRVEEIAGAMDLLPTLVSMAGIKRVGDKVLDGRDLSPLMTGNGGKEAWPERTIFSTWGRKVSARTQRYRLDEKGQLFDMVADPGQLVAVNDRKPEVEAKLLDEVNAGKVEMGFDEAKAAGANAVDPRLIGVGYREFPITMLPARDGEPLGALKRSSKAPNCSYFVNWTSLDDRMVWKVEVQTAGRYEVVIDHTCAVGDEGAEVELALGGSRLTGKVTEAWDPPLFTNQDTLPRPDGESSMKEFKELKLGVMELEKGAGDLMLRALKIPGKGVMDVRRVTLRLME